MGMVIGTVIGAIVAVLIYKNNKSEVFDNLKSTFENYFTKLTKPVEPIKSKRAPVKTPKIQVDLPPEISNLTKSEPKTTVSKPRKFIKPKK